MPSSPRMTLQTQAALEALIGQSDEPMYGFEIARISGLATGTIYPIMTRLMDAGWVTANWEDAQQAHDSGRPPRRYYKLTAEGRTRAVNALTQTRTSRAKTSEVFRRGLAEGYSTGTQGGAL